MKAENKDKPQRQAGAPSLVLRGFDRVLTNVIYSIDYPEGATNLCIHSNQPGGKYLKHIIEHGK